MGRRYRSIGRAAVRLGLLALLTALLAGCSLGSNQVAGFRFEENYRLRTGERLQDDQVLVGNRLEFDPGSEVEGSLTVIGDAVIVAGQVDDNLTVIARHFTLDSKARVGGDLTYCADQSLIQAGAQVDGVQKEECADNRRTSLETAIGIDRWQQTGFLTRLLGVLARTLFFGAVAALGMVLYPAGLRKMSLSLRAAPLASAGVGGLTLLAAAGISAIYGLSLMLVVPLLVLPLFVVAWLALGLALLVGWAAFAHPVGGRLLRRVGIEEVPPMVQAAVGGLALGLAVTIWDVFRFSGWIGVLAGLIVSAIGLGAVILTRVGTRPYPRPAPDDTTPVPL